jgi:two-component system, cell cycle sensor histidine kinase and response regulator CckA
VKVSGRLDSALSRLRGFRRRPWPRLIERLSGPLDDLLRALFHDAPAGLLIVDRSGLIVRTNAALARMAGRPTGLAPGQRADILFPADERAQIWRELALHLAGKAGAREFVTRLAVAEGAPEAPVDVSVQVLHEVDGRPGGLVLWFTDTSRQHQLEAQLAHGQKLQAVGQLAGGIAHDFNNLLTAIAGAAELILARGSDTATTEDVRQIRASAERGAALVRQLLAFGRQQRLQPRVVAINEAIGDLSALLCRLLGSKVRLELELEAPGRMVRVDPTQLDQVLVNLAVNARDAMPDGGELHLRSGHITLFRPLTRGHETIPPGRYVMIEVEDTGCGIPPEVLPRIFDPFFTTRRERGGSGLGLATAHGIVRQSEGFIAAESEPGKGTCFRIYLPRHDAADAIAMPQPPDPLLNQAPAAAVPPVAAAGEIAGDTPQGARTALLVEDEPAVGRIAERALSGHGWDVHRAESAEAVLANLEQLARPGVLVSDVVMPGMDGPNLVRRLRERWPGLPAILVSGYVEESLRRSLEAENMTFLAKPYTLANLLAVAAAAVAPGAGSSYG